MNERAIITEISISDLKEYLERVPEDYSFHKGLVFRGQRDDWNLVPSLFRLKDARGRTFIPQHFESWEVFEQALLTKFKIQATPFLNVSPNNDLEWLSIAQHYGLSTRLLDWTENPLVALYFAVEDLATEKSHPYSVVWSVGFPQARSFDPRSRSPISLNDLNKFLKMSELYYPTHILPRMSAQRGCFTITPLPRNNNEFTPINERYGRFIKFVIRNEHREKLKYQLDRIGIDDFTVNPDLNGLSKRLNWEIRREMRSDSLNRS